MKKHITLLTLMIAFILPLTIRAQFTFDVAGASSTVVTGINDSSDIVGYCIISGQYKAFSYINGDTVLYQRNTGNNTWFGGINNQRIIGGQYNTTGSTTNNIPFIYSVSLAQYHDITAFGSWSTISVNHINDNQEISGSMQSGSTREMFTYSQANGLNDIKYHDVNVTSYPTYGGHINNLGFTSGYYINGTAYVGFVYNGGSQIITDTVNILNGSGVSKLKLNAINDHNEFVGEYNGTTGYRFVIDGADRYFAKVTVTGAIEVNPLDVNNNSFTCGYYVDSTNVTHGFYERNYDLGYRPTPNGFTIRNTENDIWPSSVYANIDYSHDPILGGTHYFPTKDLSGTPYANMTYPSWQTWVNVFTMDNCYITNGISGNKVLNPNASLQWQATVDSNFQGACFGMAGMSLQAYDDYAPMQTRFPNAGLNSPVLTGITANDSIRSAISDAFTTQYCSEYQNIIDRHNRLNVTTLFDMMKKTMADTVKANDAFMCMRFQTSTNGSAGGHALVPYYIKKSTVSHLPGVFTILLYNCNNGGAYVDTMSISIYDNYGKGNFYFGPYGGKNSKKAFVLAPPPIMFRQQLTLPANLRQGTPSISRGIPGMVRLGFNQGDQYTATNPLSQTAGWDGTVSQDGIDNAWLVYPISGYNSIPRSMYVPADDYTVQTKKTRNGSAGMFSFATQSTFYVQRYNALVNETDNFTYNGGPGYVNNSGGNRMLRIESVVDTNHVVTDYVIDSLMLGNTSSVTFENAGENELVIKNNGAATTYHLQVNIYTDTAFTSFTYSNIPIDANTSHIVHPTNTSSAVSEWIYVDNGQNGSIDDTLFYANQSPPALQLSQSSIQLPGTSGTDTIGVSNTGGGTFNWQVTSVPAWVTVTQGNTGTQQGKVAFSYSANTGAARTGYIVITAVGAINSPDSVLVHQDGFVGIAENEIGISGIELYPNPVNDIVQLKAKDAILMGADIFVYDMAGKQVMSARSESSTDVKLNMSLLETGSYIISVKSGSTLFKKMFVVVK